MATAILNDTQALVLDAQVRKAHAGELADQVLVDLVEKNVDYLNQILLENEFDALPNLADEATERLKSNATASQEADEVATFNLERDPYREFREKVACDFQTRGFGDAAQALRDFVPGATTETMARIATILNRDIVKSGVWGKFEKLAWKVHYLAMAAAGLPDDDVIEAIAEFEENGDTVFAERMRALPKAVADKNQSALEAFNSSADEFLGIRQPQHIYMSIFKMVKAVVAVLLETYVGFVNEADEAIVKGRIQDAYDALIKAREIAFGKCGLKAIEGIINDGKLPECFEEWIDEELEKELLADTAEGKRAFALFNGLTKPLHEELLALRQAQKRSKPSPFGKIVMRRGKTARDHANVATRRQRQVERAEKRGATQSGNPNGKKAR